MRLRALSCAALCHRRRGSERPRCRAPSSGDRSCSSSYAWDVSVELSALSESVALYRAQWDFVAPDFQGEWAFLCAQPIDHRSGAPPAGLLIESSGTRVTDRASEPGGLSSTGAKPHQRIAHKCGSNLGATSFGRNIKLVELIAHHH